MLLSLLLFSLVLVAANEDDPGGPPSSSVPHPKVRGTWPTDVCGDWHEDYAAFHRSIRSLSAEQRNRGSRTSQHSSTEPELRFATFTCTKLNRCGGVGDVLLGVYSTFLVALLQGRALVVNHPLVSATFDPAWIDWRMSADVEEEKPTSKNEFKYGSSAPVLVDLQDTIPENPEAFFSRLNSSSNLHITWNRGAVTRIFKNNGAWAARLRRLGFRLPFAFGCVFRLLFWPKPAIWRLVAPTLRQLDRPGATNLCIHVRTPDERTWGRDGQVVTAGGAGGEGEEASAQDLLQWATEKVLACAQKVEGYWFNSEDRVQWVFSSNSVTIKEEVKAAWKDKVRGAENDST